MSLKLITKLSQLHEAIAVPSLSVVDFYASWCPPCKMITPKLTQLATEKPHIQFIKIDVDLSQEISSFYKIKAMPTFIFFKNNKQVEMFEGADWGKLLEICEKYGDNNNINNINNNNISIPPDNVLLNMSTKELLNIISGRNISTVGLVEKGDLVEELKKHR
eukprot:Tbor_TRINITY_DN5507_c0_g4::TRINITY_DN5507_c0_g4_i2::g.12892::m.12892/K03671/trxA; thioredoxin 1